MPDSASNSVPFLDVDAMATQIAAWAAAPATARAMGERARARVLDAFDVSVGAPRWWDELEALLP